MTARTTDEWKEFYKEHKEFLSIPELSKKYGMHVQSFYTAFKRLKLPIIVRENNYGANYNHEFFNNINSELKAYLLGWLMSDGYVTTRNRIGIKLNKKDIEILELFKNSIAPNVSILKDGNGRVIQFQSKKLYSAVVKLGIVRNKTYKETHIPNINKDLVRHFIRGYFDGDGSISVGKNNKKSTWYICSINKVILEEMQLEMQPYGIVSKIYTEDRSMDNYKDMHKLLFNGYLEDKQFAFNYLYDSSIYYLKRKFIKLNNLYGNTEVSLENNESRTP